MSCLMTSRSRLENSATPTVSPPGIALGLQRGLRHIALAVEDQSQGVQHAGRAHGLREIAGGAGLQRFADRLRIDLTGEDRDRHIRPPSAARPAARRDPFMPGMRKSKQDQIQAFRRARQLEHLLQGAGMVNADVGVEFLELSFEQLMRSTRDRQRRSRAKVECGPRFILPSGHPFLRKR